MHKSVLLKESIQYLNLDEDSIVVDCTLGYGGHSSSILTRIPKGHLYAFDQDEQAIQYSKKRLIEIGHPFTIVQDNFVNMKKQLEELEVTSVDAVLFDLGVSSPQLDQQDRGFSFHQDARLDMRMNQSQTLSAYEVVNDYPLEQLIDIFYRYGEETYAKSIALSIVASRPIETTLELVDVIKQAVPSKYRNTKHPARKVFQAIRIEVNNELQVFEQAFMQALSLLKVGGRICVITFHSLEDRLCKKMMKEKTNIPKEVLKLPMIPKEYQPAFKIIKLIEPSKQELEENPKARSARLRVIEKIKAD